MLAELVAHLPAITQLHFESACFDQITQYTVIIATRQLHQPATTDLVFPYSYSGVGSGVRWRLLDKRNVD